MTPTQERVRQDFWTAVLRGLPHGAPSAAVRLSMAQTTVQGARIRLVARGLMPQMGSTSKLADPAWRAAAPEEFLPPWEGEPAVSSIDGPPGQGDPDAMPPLQSLGGDVRMPMGRVAVAPTAEPPEPAEETQALRRQLAEARRLHQQYREDQGQIRLVLQEIVEHVQALPAAQILYHKPKATRVSTPIGLVIHNSDWHMGACQDQDEIEGFNEFSPDVLRQRIRTFAADVLDWTALHRHAYDVDECCVLVTGDLISGDIHDELRVTNAWPAPVQLVEAARLLAEEVQLLAPHFARVVVEYVCADNHGRLTKKVQHKEGGYNTFGFPLGVLAQEMLRDHDNVEFRVHPKEQVVVDFKGRRYLLCHGHQIRGWAGFPWYGVDRKVGKEAVKRMRSEIGRFDRIVLGHFHTPLATPLWLMGGSASGTDAFDHSQGRESQPVQCAWFVHPRHGEFDRTDWELRTEGAA